MQIKNLEIKYNPNNKYNRNNHGFINLLVFTFLYIETVLSYLGDGTNLSAFAIPENILSRTV